MANTNNGGRGGRAPFAPTREWIEALDRQSATKEFVEAAHRYATVRAAMVARAGRKIDELYIRALVHDALVDTLTGILSWDPDRVDLEKHIHDAIKSRTRHDRDAAKKMSYLDAPGVEAFLVAPTSDGTDEAAEGAMRILGGLRAEAAGDADVLLLFDAYDRDAFKKEDAMRATGLTSKRYKAAWARLRRLAKKHGGGES